LPWGPWNWEGFAQHQAGLKEKRDVTGFVALRGTDRGKAESPQGDDQRRRILDRRADFRRVPGASAYFVGGAVVYTRVSRTELLRVTEEEFAAMAGITPSTEPYALLFARKIRERLSTNWAVGETGTAGPTGSRYGHAAGHSCVGVIGPNGERAITIETGKDDRVDNMRTFSIEALTLLEKAIG
jgi:nicotinamide-nucleotide amidase